MRRILSLTLVATLGAVSTAAANAPSLRGSPAAMVQQNQVAKEHSLNFYRTGQEILSAVERGELVKLEGNANFSVASFVSFPYLQPEGLLFVERLSEQYRVACGQKLVVTSAVRPSSGQPSNAHRLSVHPAGMAVDLRVSDRAACREWLENALLEMESRGVLNGIREFSPPHYHVAIFPTQYREYAEERMAIEAAQRLEEAAVLAAAAEEVDVAVILEEAGVTSALVPADEKSSREGLRAALFALIAVPFGLGMALRKKLTK
ncbi:hypothetical protein BH23GEM6_BH23GEM6_23460 [soil metagenome]